MRLYKIKKSKIDKNGLYANCNIKKGTKIIEYKGKIISVKKSAPFMRNGGRKWLCSFPQLLRNCGVARSRVLQIMRRSDRCLRGALPPTSPMQHYG